MALLGSQTSCTGWVTMFQLTTCKCSVEKNRVAKIMKNIGISAQMKPKFKILTTNSKHHYPISANLLNQDFQVAKPNRVWVSEYHLHQDSRSLAVPVCHTGSVQ